MSVDSNTNSSFLAVFQAVKLSGVPCCAVDSHTGPLQRRRGRWARLVSQFVVFWCSAPVGVRPRPLNPPARWWNRVFEATAGQVRWVRTNRRRSRLFGFASAGRQRRDRRCGTDGRCTRCRAPQDRRDHRGAAFHGPRLASSCTDQRGEHPVSLDDCCADVGRVGRQDRSDGQPAGRRCRGGRACGHGLEPTLRRRSVGDPMASRGEGHRWSHVDAESAAYHLLAVWLSGLRVCFGAPRIRPVSLTMGTAALVWCPP